MTTSQQAPMQALIPGVEVVLDNTSIAPSILVLGAEKSGKSTMCMSLQNWPRPGAHPLFIAWDANGPNSCLAFGYRPHVMVVEKQAGASLWDKTRGLLAVLESRRSDLTKVYGSIVIDCTSTMISFLLDDYRRTTKNPDPRHPYAEVERWWLEFHNRIVRLGLPVVWLSWLREPELVEEKQGGAKIARVVPGGALIDGKKICSKISGKAHHIFALEKVKLGIGSQGADPEGYVRQLRGKPWRDIVLGGRFTNDLPDICPPDLNWVLCQITGVGPYPKVPVQR